MGRLIERIKKKKGILKWIFLAGIFIGFGLFVTAYQVSVFFSSNESCMMCHIHPHAEQSWKRSVHVNSRSGVITNCVDCHLPPKDQTWNHYSAKVKLGIKDLWGYLVKDSADIDWDLKSELDQAVKFVYNASCKACHANLFPAGINDDAIISHLYYEENEKKLNLQCISCHLDAGHYNPNYTHGRMTGIKGFDADADKGPVFDSPTLVTSFENYVEQIPGTNQTISMIAIPGGTFKMGSDPKEPFHKADEAPVRNVTVSPFFMAEIQVTWDLYWTFIVETQSEGRTPPEVIYENNSNPDLDAVAGPTPPYGNPDQGWGTGMLPAITMTHYAAETFCQWVSFVTGKKYRLPTEAEWEYAVRGGTETPYFFEGNPKDFSDKGFMRRFKKAKTDVISDFAIYRKNSNNRPQEPDMVKPNPFGLKNMVGNVWEYCADKYSAKAYSKTGLNVTNPIETEGDEHVIRGGYYYSDASDLRSATRSHTNHDDWIKTDPQQPKSIWWYTDMKGIGFRVVCEPDQTIINN